MKKPEEYKAIELWGRYMGSHKPYIRDQQERAAETDAPVDAIFEDVLPGGVRTGKWSKVSDLPQDHDFRIAYGAQYLAGQMNLREVNTALSFAEEQLVHNPKMAPYVAALTQRRIALVEAGRK